jgi:hypothetical protein
MIGRLLSTTSAFALTAVAGLFATSAKAADLSGVGGSCCADLEERVAELEATTARKGNRKVNLTVSGHINETLLFWDDGEESNAYVVTNENSRTRFRFVGDARINPEWSAGYLLEIAARIAGSHVVDQFVDDNTSSTASLDLRHSAWWIESSRLGRVWVGHTGMATNDITEINLSNASVIGLNEIDDWNGGFFLRDEDGDLSGVRWADIYSQANAHVGEGDRRNLVKYVAPTLRGFTFSTAWGEDDFWDAALRYAGEFKYVRVAAGIGYQTWTDGNATRGPAPGVPTGSQGDRGCADLDFIGGNDSDVDCWAVGMSGSIMHVPSGLYVTAAYGFLEDENRGELFAGSTFAATGVDDEDEHWYLQAGIERNFFGIGKSTFYGEYFRTETGAGLDGGDVRRVVAADALNALGANAFIASAEVDIWGFGFVQAIDAAAMDLYIGYRNYSGEVELSTGGALPRSDSVDVEDFRAVMAGGRIRF